MGTPVTWWEINARDGAKAKQFYSDLFGWAINSENPMNYGLVDTGSAQGAMGGISQVNPEFPAPPVTFYVQVEDPQAYLDKAIAMGGRMVAPVTEVPDMVTFALFADPEGNVIGLVKGVDPPPAPKKRAAPKKAKPKAKPKAKAKAKAKKPAKKKARRR